MKVTRTDFNFPQTITPMKNGKFLFHPQNFYQGESLFVEVEGLQNNQRFNFSFIDFPLNISDEVTEFFIFKV